MSTPSTVAVFLAGLFSFLSPCILPLVPVYLAYITGVSARSASPLLEGSGSLTLAHLKVQTRISPRLHTFLHALFFVVGFAIFFTLLGLSAGALGGILQEQRELLRQIAGVFLIVFGLHTLGIINIPFLNGGLNINVETNPRLGYFSSALVGTGFAIGHLPCIGVTMSAVYTLAFDSANLGSAATLFFIYSLGLGVPFLATSLAVGSVGGFLKRIAGRGVTWRLGRLTLIRDLNIISLISGLLLIVVGWSIFTNSLIYFNQFMPRFDWTFR